MNEEIEKEKQRQETFLTLGFPIFTDLIKIQESRQKIIDQAIQFKGVKFAHRGRTRYGLDCLGLNWICYRRAGIELPDGDGRVYEVNWYFFSKEERYLENLLKWFKWTETPKMGDIPLFKCFNKKITHCGLWLDKEKDFIHAFSASKVKTDSLNQKWFKHRFKGFVTYRGFMEE